MTDFNERLSAAGLSARERYYGFYTVDPVYCDFLREYDYRVPKGTRELYGQDEIGVVVSLYDSENLYYIPVDNRKISQPFTEQDLSFMKIDYAKNGALLFSKMIPVTDDVIYKPNLDETPVPDKRAQAEKIQRQRQTRWARRNCTRIVHTAERLYDNVLSSSYLESDYAKKCCDFVALERARDQYGRKSKTRTKR